MSIPSSNTPPPEDLAEIFANFLVSSASSASYRSQRQLLDTHGNTADASQQDIITAPLFTGSALFLDQHTPPEMFVQYGLLGRAVSWKEADGDAELSIPDDRIFLNTNVPWSAFICGSQGSGKSHTLSCMLENCLQKDTRLGPLPQPPSALVFSYTSETSSASQPCEAAHLASSGIPVTVLVSPTNYAHMQELYRSIPSSARHKPNVKALQFARKHLNVQRMMTLMAVSQTGHQPLYMEVVRKILREMAVGSNANEGFNYPAFKANLKLQNFTRDQQAPLDMRLSLLESFLAPEGAKVTFMEDWKREGVLTIVDLSCPFVDQGNACSLFDIMLGMFLETPIPGGRVVALDEAHKYLVANECPSATKFTESLLTVIRQQRHLGTRIIISTQEPTLSPKLLDLSTISIIHRFTSPNWYKVLKEHLAGAAIVDEGQWGNGELFKTILRLQTGESLVFCPAGLFTSVDFGGMFGMEFVKLEARLLKMKTRMRLTSDGGKSILSNVV